MFEPWPRGGKTDERDECDGERSALGLGRDGEPGAAESQRKQRQGVMAEAVYPRYFPCLFSITSQKAAVRCRCGIRAAMIRGGRLPCTRCIMENCASPTRQTFSCSGAKLALRETLARCTRPRSPPLPSGRLQPYETLER